MTGDSSPAPPQLVQEFFPEADPFLQSKKNWRSKMLISPLLSCTRDLLAALHKEFNHKVQGQPAWCRLSCSSQASPLGRAMCSPLSESALTVGTGFATPAMQSGCIPMAEVFESAVSSFKVHDWNLFGAGAGA